MILLQTVESLVAWRRVAIEYVGFLSYFAIFGAVGFHLFVTRPVQRRAGVAGVAGVSYRWDLTADATAARIGVVGAVFGLINVAGDAARHAAEKGLGLSLAIREPASLIRVALLLVILLAFLSAVRAWRTGWTLAAIAAVMLILREVVNGRLMSMINPLHQLAASLWIGTLFVLLVAGVPAVLRSDLPRESREALVAELVHSFSALALWLVGALVLTGIITAWRHLKYVAALWTTPYGLTFLLKLCFVAVVFAIGFYNWRRVKPSLGRANAATLRRSAAAEVAVAAVVLGVTAVLVSLPTPKLPKAAPAAVR